MTIAKYEFNDSQSADAAATKIRYEFNHSSCYQHSNYVEITDECKDPAKAAQICLANGGRPK